MFFRPIFSAGRTACLVLLAAACLASGARGDVKLDLFPGFDNAYRPDSWTPLTVRMTGAGVDAPGKLQLLVRLRQGGDRVYSLPLRLHAGALNEQHTLYYIHPDQADVQDMIVQLQAEGRVLAEKRLEGALPIYEGQPVVVGLTQDQSGLNYLTAIDTGYEHQSAAQLLNNPYGNPGYGGPNNPGLTGKNPTRVIYPRADTLPDSAFGYRSVDAVTLGDMPLDKLTDAQWDALVNWVKDGGVLVISGGADISRVRSQQLVEILPVTPTGVKQVRALSSLAYRYGSEPGFASTPIITGALKSDAMALCRENGAPVVSYRRLGTGVVVFTAFDALAPEFRAWPGQARMWQEIMHLGAGELRLGQVVRAANQSGPYGRWYGNMGGGYGYRNTIQDALAGVQATEAPSFTYIGLFLLAYIIFLVPVNYFLLKKRDKKELAWITAPLIILAFSTGAYAVGYSIKGGQLFLRYCSVVEGAANTDAWTVYTVATIYSPRQRRYDLSVADPAALATEVTEEASGYHRASGDLVIERGQATAVKGALVNMWDHRSFDFESRVNLDGGISASVLPAGGGLVAVRVTNNTKYPLSDCALTQGGSVTIIGAVAPGETRSAHISLQSGGYGGGLPLGGGDFTDPTVRRIKQALVSIISQAQVAGQNAPRPLLFTGWFSEPVTGLAIADEQPRMQGINLLVVHLAPAAALTAAPQAWQPPPSNPDPFAGRPGRMYGMGGGPVIVQPRAAMDANYYNNLAYRYANQGNLSNALNAANRALQLAPNDGNILDTVAEMYQRRKAYATAAQFYVRALANQSGGGIPETHEKYGETLLALGKKQEAVRQWKQAAQDPGSWGQKARAKLQSLGVNP
jgi:hypothetical protein